MSLFADIFQTSVVPTLLEIFKDSREWEYADRLGDPWRKVVVHVGNVETQIVESLEREKKFRGIMLVLTADPDHEYYPGLAEVAKSGVFRAPSADGNGEIYSVADDEMDTRSPSLIRVRVKLARMTKIDRYAEQ